jgi:hypothetical protein
LVSLMVRLSCMDMRLIQEKAYGTTKRNRRIRALYNGARPTLEELGVLAWYITSLKTVGETPLVPLSRQRVFQIVKGGRKCGDCTAVPDATVISTPNQSLSPSTACSADCQCQPNNSKK